jgi:hypothetical protein
MTTTSYALTRGWREVVWRIAKGDIIMRYCHWTMGETKSPINYMLATIWDFISSAIRKLSLQRKPRVIVIGTHLSKEAVECIYTVHGSNTEITLVSPSHASFRRCVSAMATGQRMIYIPKQVMN